MFKEDIFFLPKEGKQHSEEFGSPVVSGGVDRIGDMFRTREDGSEQDRLQTLRSSRLDCL